MSRVSRGFKKFGKVAKWLFGLFVLLLVAFLLWRIFDLEAPDSMQPLSVNESLKEAYDEHGDALEIFTQEHLTVTTNAERRGYFAISRALFIPQANQIQIVLRYNNSTIRHLQEDYSLAEAPARESDIFDVNLFFTVDLTPENTEDNDILSEQGTRTFRCSSRQVASDMKSLHNYRMFVFQLDECGEDLEQLVRSGLLLAVYADIYYVEDMDTSERAYASLFLYDYATKNDKWEMDELDAERIKAWKEEE